MHFNKFWYFRIFNEVYWLNWKDEFSLRNLYGESDFKYLWMILSYMGLCFYDKISWWINPLSLCQNITIKSFQKAQKDIKIAIRGLKKALKKLKSAIKVFKKDLRKLTESKKIFQYLKKRWIALRELKKALRKLRRLKKLKKLSEGFIKIL